MLVIQQMVGIIQVGILLRYWVGGTADWDGTAGTKWAYTSGGVGGGTSANSYG